MAQPSSPARRVSVREFLGSRLRAKITLPYLLLAIILGIAVTFIAAQILVRDLEERFTHRLIDAATVITDTTVQIEREQLAVLRAIAHTEGVAEVLRAGNDQQLLSLIQPLAINNRVELVELVDLKGGGHLAMHHRLNSTRPDDYIYDQKVNYGDWWVYQKVARGATDQNGDKFADLVRTPWGSALYFAGPVKAGDELVGVVLVGSYLDSVAQRFDGESLTNVTLFDPLGKPLATTLKTREPERSRLSTEELRRILSTAKTGTFIRPTLAGFGTRNFSEAFGIWSVRKDHPVGFFSVAGARDDFVTSSAGELRTQMSIIFGLGILLIILMGVLIAGSIVQPVTTLARASRSIAEGNLETHVDVKSKDEIGTLADAFNRMVDGLRERELIKDLFGRLVSREVRETLLENTAHGGVKLGGEVRDVTMLFTDIRNFTTMSERYDPTLVVSFLNEYFTAMLETVDRYHGLVNKFGGDSTLVVFGAPIVQPDHARRAVLCALAMRRRLREFNDKRVGEGYEPIRIGIGINTGSVVAGQVGSVGRFEYTVVGDAVNVTSRLEAFTKEFSDYDIIISESTLIALGPAGNIEVADLGYHHVKGKETQVRIFGVIGEGTHLGEGTRRGEETRPAPPVARVPEVIQPEPEPRVEQLPAQPEEFTFAESPTVESEIAEPTAEIETPEWERAEVEAAIAPVETELAPEPELYPPSPVEAAQAEVESVPPFSEERPTPFAELPELELEEEATAPPIIAEISEPAETVIELQPEVRSEPGTVASSLAPGDGHGVQVSIEEPAPQPLAVADSVLIEEGVTEPIEPHAAATVEEKPTKRKRAGANVNERSREAAKRALERGKRG